MGPPNGTSGVCAQCGVVHPLDASHSYRFVGEVDGDLQCQICLNALQEPVDTPCGHTFCFSCIRPYQRQRKSCPVDRKPLSRTELRPSTMLVRRLLDKLLVHCPMRENCREEIKRSELEEHLKTRCPGMLVPCPRADVCGCEFVGPRCMLERHLWTCLASGGECGNWNLTTSKYCLYSIHVVSADVVQHCVPTKKCDDLFPWYPKLSVVGLWAALTE